MLRHRRDKHKVRVGDVFLFRETDRDGKPDPQLFLVEKANTFVYLAGEGGYGHYGSSTTRGSLGRRGNKRPFAVTLSTILGYRHMNQMIEKDEAVRIAHYDEIATAREAVQAWGRQEVDVLEVPVPGTPVAPKLVAIVGGQT